MIKRCNKGRKVRFTVVYVLTTVQKRESKWPRQEWLKSSYRSSSFHRVSRVLLTNSLHISSAVSYFYETDFEIWTGFECFFIFQWVNKCKIRISLYFSIGTKTLTNNKE